MSRIISLTAENVKRISAVHITPSPKSNVVIIGGRNGQGKTSVLDCIGMALGGANEVPVMPIRAGESSAKIVLETEDLVITRRFTAKGSDLIVENRDKMKATAPQSILDRLTGKLTFDPVAFMRLDPAKQREALRKLVKIDFTEDDRNRAILFAERTAINRDLNAAAAVLHSLPNHIGVQAEEISVADTVAELEAGQTANQKAKDLADAAETAESEAMEAASEIDRIQRGIADYEAEIARLQRQIAELRTLQETKTAVHAAAKTKAEEAARIAAEAQTIDLTPIRQKLAGAETVNAKVRANKKRAEQQTTVNQLDAKAKELTASIDLIDAEKKKKLAEAKFPVAGLSFDELGVTFGGIPLAQTSAADQLRISVAMAAALNPQLRVMLVRDGSLLDEDSLALLEQLSSEHNLQVWVERVGKGDKTAVIIEDGAVWERAEEAPAA